MKILLAACAAIMLAGCINSDYDFTFFPPCDEKAPAHYEVVTKYNTDAVRIGAAATENGWVNVQVDGDRWASAKVSGDCPFSKEEVPE